MLTGRCLCGGVRFEIAAPLGPAVCCHCSMCRRASGSAFAANASVRADAFRIVSGEDLLSSYESSPGAVRMFCSRCGSPVCMRGRDDMPLVRVRLGLIEDDPGIRPSAHVWTQSKARWFEITDALRRFAREGPRRYFMPG